MKLNESYINVLKESVSGGTKKPVLTEVNAAAVLKKVDSELLNIPNRKELISRVLNNPKIKALQWNKAKEKLSALMRRKAKLSLLKSKLMKAISSETFNRR